MDLDRSIGKKVKAHNKLIYKVVRHLQSKVNAQEVKMPCSFL